MITSTFPKISFRKLSLLLAVFLLMHFSGAISYSGTAPSESLEKAEIAEIVALKPKLAMRIPNPAPASGSILEKTVLKRITCKRGSGSLSLLNRGKLNLNLH